LKKLTLVLKTKKLYYNKWPIKVECRLNGASYIARLGPTRFIEWCDDDSFPMGFDRRQGFDKPSLKKFANTFLEFAEDDLQVRGEGMHFNIFLKDTALLDKIEKKMSTWIFSINKPESDKEFEYLLAHSSKKVLCDNLPYEKYKFKVTLKENIPLETKAKFLEWLLKYKDQALVSKSSLDWLHHKKMWVQAPFFYVETDKHLSMVLLYLGSYVRKTQEFILKSSINSSCLD